MRRNKLLLLVSSLVTMALLITAAYQENVAREWRQLQRRYASRLESSQAGEFDVHLRQVYVPALGATDRCISCHVGMAPGESGVDGDPVFARHPDLRFSSAHLWTADEGRSATSDGSGAARASRKGIHSLLHFRLFPVGETPLPCCRSRPAIHSDLESTLSSEFS